jgi:hypothetical protein
VRIKTEKDINWKKILILGFGGYKMKLTGKAFVNGEKFQLEAIINNKIIRLEAEGDIPKSCLTEKKHDLKIIGATDNFPPKYVISCECGYSQIMDELKNYSRGSK